MPRRLSGDYDGTEYLNSIKESEPSPSESPVSLEGIDNHFYGHLDPKAVKTKVINSTGGC